MGCEAYADEFVVRLLTSDDSPLYQNRRLGPLRPGVLECCASAILALQPELVFRGELAHVRGPLPLGLVGAVVFVLGAEVAVFGALVRR